MRTIKFRAWDKREKQMHEIRDLHWDNHGGLEGEFSCVDYMGKSWESLPHLMQFTGLLDKNGKEIYEGDILRQTYKADCVEEGGRWIEAIAYGARPRKVEHTVTVSDLRMVFDQMPKARGISNLSDCIYEVIGNIYENPDLLKASESNAKP